MEEKVKIYYDKSTGYLCGRYPKDLPIGESTPFIEVAEEEASETYVCEYGKVWAVKNGSLQKVEDAETTASDEYKAYARENEISSLKNYLTETDYVISKLNELKLEDEDEYETEKAKYSDVLKKRKEARARINDLSEGE